MTSETEQPHSSLVASEQGDAIRDEEHAADEGMVRAAIRAHEIAAQAESAWASAVAATRMAEIARDRAEAVVDILEERAREGRPLPPGETRRRLADIEELQNANRLATVGKLTASMAHELGTPLAIINVRAQMIAGGEVPSDEIVAEARAILQQTQRMAGMVRDVLELARPKAMEQAPVDLSLLGHQVVSMLAPLARKRNVKLELVAPPAAMVVRGDASRLLQILTNLVINAAQSTTRPGTVTLSIELRVVAPPDGDGEAADYLAFDVSDEGEGIAPHVLPRIFDTFFTTRRGGDGTGLGLSISSRIAREHGGFIGVTSELGHGSRFSLYLPPLRAR